MLEASGLFEADSVFLNKKGVCAVLQDIAFHLEREFGRAPKSVANVFVYMWKQTLVIREVSCFLSWHNPAYGLSACWILMWIEDLEGKSIWCHVGELQPDP